MSGEHPNLGPTDLANGDSKFAIDFHSVYAALLEQWLKTPSAPVVGRGFEPIQLI